MRLFDRDIRCIAVWALTITLAVSVGYVLGATA